MQKATWSHTVIPSICDLCYWNLIKKIELEFLKRSGLADRAWQTQELVTGWAGGRCGDSLQRSAKQAVSAMTRAAVTKITGRKQPQGGRA